MSRTALLDAATRLALSGALDAGVDAQRIAADAQSTLREYQREFPSDGALLEALHGHHVSMLVGEISAAMESLPQGRRRMDQAIEVFWTGCIERLPLRQLVKRGRADGALDAAVQRRNRAFEYLLAAELQAIGDPAPADSARLLRALVEEVAQAEFEAGAPLPALRTRFRQLLDDGLAPRGAAVT